jgi:hypothetical protein
LYSYESIDEMLYNTAAFLSLLNGLMDVPIKPRVDIGISWPADFSIKSS